VTDLRDDGSRMRIARLAPLTLLLASMLVAEVALAVPISNRSFSAPVVGSGQPSQWVGTGARAAFLHGGIVVPKGGPFGNSTITFELDEVGVSGKGLAKNMPSFFTLFGTPGGVLGIGRGPAPRALDVRSVRLNPHPKVVSFGNGPATQTSDPTGALEWQEAVRSSQVGGTVSAGAGSTPFVNAIPEPGAAAVFAVGLLLVSRFSMRRPGASPAAASVSRRA
jgi:hypothetical protein